MNAARIFGASALASLLVGCQISSNVEFKTADFSGEKLYKKGHAGKPHLSELDVVGIKHSGKVSDAEIARVLDATQSFSLRRGASLLVVQSGASIPDPAMQDELAHHFRVAPHSGVLSEIMANHSDSTELSKALRLAAAHSNAEAILCYWGNLDLMRKELGTSIVSWVPVVDVIVPDEYQKLRMRLRMALIDVRTGNYSVFQAEPFEEDVLSTRFAREHTDPAPLNALKKRAYQAAVRDLIKGYVQ